MVIWKNREKNKKKEKVLCGGKLILTDFGKLDPQMFQPDHEFTKEKLKEEVLVIMSDGRIFVNSGMECGELLVDIYKVILPETRYHLEQYKKKIRKQFPDIRTLSDWGAWAEVESDNEKKLSVLTSILIEYDFKRRNMEKAYYMR